MNCPETNSENCVEHCTFVDYKSMYVSVLYQTEMSIINHINKASCTGKCTTAGLSRRWFTNVKTTQKTGTTQYEILARLTCSQQPVLSTSVMYIAL